MLIACQNEMVFQLISLKHFKRPPSHSQAENLIHFQYPTIQFAYVFFEIFHNLCIHISSTEAMRIIGS